MRTLRIVVILCLTVLSVLPETMPRVHAVSSNGSGYWSAFGPRMDTLQYTVFSDFTSVFTAFQNGQIDITDFPISPADLSNFINNPDFFVTPKHPISDIFHLDMNHQDPFLGMNWQVPRGTNGPGATPATTGSPLFAPGTPTLSITNIVACGSCPTNTFQLRINLTNIEEGSSSIKDSNNLVTATIVGTSLPLVSKGDDGGATPSGAYTISLSSIPSSYIISTTIYSGSATLFTTGTTQPICSAGQSCTAVLKVNYNSPSTQKPSVAGVEIFRALAHLLDKPSFLTGPYLTTAGGTTLATCDDVPVSSASSLMIAVGAGACDHNSSPDAATLQAECGDANIAGLFGVVPGTTAGTCASSVVSLYNLKADSIGGAASCVAGNVGVSCLPSQSASPPPAGYSGLLDLAASCAYFLEAGFTTTGAGTGTISQQCGNVAQGTGHINNNGAQILFYIRTDPSRRAYGTIVADSINYLFGTPAPTGGTVNYGGCGGTSGAVCYYTIGQISSFIFSVSTVADWNLYTGAHTGSSPEAMFALYHSQFSGGTKSTGSLCGGPLSTFPNNYPLYCDPVFDTQANAAETVSGIMTSAFMQAAILGATRGATIPVYSHQSSYAALNAWNWQRVGAGTGSSLVPLKGLGFLAGSGSLTTINMRPVPGYIPSNSLFYASGCNPSAGCEQNTIRRSMSETTIHISPYTATSAWDFEPLGQIYDSMLAVDPNTDGLCQPGGTAHCVDWMTTSHSISFDATVDKTTQLWDLRSDIYWHDGQPVTAHDVCFTIISYRDAPSFNFFPSVSNVNSCATVGNKIIKVVLNGTSPSGELNIGGVLIVPEHVWAPLCGGLVAGTDSCVTPSSLASTSLDPVASGDMVGSGPWICNPSLGVSTIAGQASCAQNSDGSPGGQSLVQGAKIILKRNLGYMRCCENEQSPQNGLATTNLQALEWADANKDGKVTILDIALAASVFGHTCTTTDLTACYFAHPLYSANPSGGKVDIGDIATVAFEFENGLTAPFLGTPTGAFTATPPAGLTQLDPRTDPLEFSVGTSLVYFQGVTRSGTSLTANVDYVLGGVPALTMNVYTDGASASGSVVVNDGGGHTLVCGNATFGSTGTAACTLPTGSTFDLEIVSGGTQVIFLEVGPP